MESSFDSYVHRWIKSEQGVGFGIYSEQLSISHKLLTASSIYTAELYAILETLNMLNENI